MSSYCVFLLMKQEIIEKIEIPENVEVSVEENLVKVKYNHNETSRRFNFYGVEVKKEGNEVIIESKKATKRELKVIYTIKAHINNMFSGIREPFLYKMEIAFVHFPMTVEHDKNKGILTIKNFLGEKKPRIVKINKGVEIKIEKNIVTVTSNNKELAGQSAANIEKATHVRNKDRRKFQDGIFITEKPGRII